MITATEVGKITPKNLTAGHQEIPQKFYNFQTSKQTSFFPVEEFTIILVKS